MIDIGIVTDEVSHNLEEAFEICTAWGLSHFELREGESARFPFFSLDEIKQVELAVARGDHITAVSPGLMKGYVEDEQRREHELNDVLPRAIDLAQQVESPLLIVFGFSRYEDEPDTHRLHVLRAFERVAEAAADAGLTVAIENEPGFWIDRHDETVSLLRELGHPSMRINWDPANLHWGGMLPTYDAFCMLGPYLANVHVKDFIPDDPETPWRPLGRGTTPWDEILPWIVEKTDLTHLTLETHCEPLQSSSEESLDTLRRLITNIA